MRNAVIASRREAVLACLQFALTTLVVVLGFVASVPDDVVGLALPAVLLALVLIGVVSLVLARGRRPLLLAGTIVAGVAVLFFVLLEVVGILAERAVSNF